jgi:hypothetical protein
VRLHDAAPGHGRQEPFVPPALAIHLSEGLVAELADRVTEPVLSRIEAQCGAQSPYLKVKEAADYVAA